MRKSKIIGQLDQRPKLRNTLRAADQKIDKKRYAPQTREGEGTGTGWGPDFGIEGEPCAGVARFGKTASWSSGKPNLAMVMAWDEAGYDAEFDGDPPYIFFTNPQTVRIKCRYTNVSADAQDRSFIQFYLSGDDASLGNYMIIKPTSPFPWPVFWNGGSSPVADGSEFDELDVSGIDIGEWFWIRTESSSEYVKFKIWQDGDEEPASWGAIAQRPPGDTQDITGSRFRELVNNWASTTTAGFWIWEFGYFDVTGGDVDYGNPTDLFDRTVEEGWGTSTSGWPWTLTTGNASHAEAAIDVSGSSGSGSTTELVWEDNFNRVGGPGVDGWDPPSGGGYYDADSNAEVDGTSGHGTAYFYLYTDSSTTTLFDLGTFPIEYHVKIIPDAVGYTWEFDLFANADEGINDAWFSIIPNTDSDVEIDFRFPTSGGMAFREELVGGSFGSGGNSVPIETKLQVHPSFSRMKVWPSSQSEPSDWITLDSTYVNWPNGAAPDLASPNGNLFGENPGTDMGIDFIKVYKIDFCGQEITSLSGLYAVQGFGPESPGAAVIPGILATCTRVDARHYNLPTDALYVKDLYIDGVRLNSWQWNFVFNSGTLITIYSDVSADAVVRARYVPA